MPTEDMRKRVIRAGFFVGGKMVSWDMQPPGIVRIEGKGNDVKVMCGDVEMEEWTKKLKKSMASRTWVQA